MPFDPWRRRAKERAVESREFTDGGDTFRLTLRELNAVDCAAQYDRIDSLCKQYIEEGQPFPAVGGEVVRLSHKLIECATLLEAMQPEDAPERYDALDLIAMAHGLAPETWIAIQDFAAAVNRNAAKNASGPAGDTSCAPASDTSGAISS